MRPCLLTSANMYYEELNYVFKVVSESNVSVLYCNTLEYLSGLSFDYLKWNDRTKI